MAGFIKIEFEGLSQDECAIAIALLSAMNYEGFEEKSNQLVAYIAGEEFDEEALAAFARSQGFHYTFSKLENKNWNKEWESNFHPVIIKKPGTDEAIAGIRADFHAPLKGVLHEIIITPKMSFGTGHHATTAMMLRVMTEIDFSGRKVLDFGTGTGILAIFAYQRGASYITAIDIDDQSIENAIENFARNDCSHINIYRGDSARGNDQFDIILANIIRQVIIANLESLSGQLLPGGILLLSGLLEDDEEIILTAAKKYHLELKRKITEEGWICLQMSNKMDIHTFK